MARRVGGEIWEGGQVHRGQRLCVVCPVIAVICFASRGRACNQTWKNMGKRPVNSPFPVRDRTERARRRHHELRTLHRRTGLMLRARLSRPWPRRQQSTRNILDAMDLHGRARSLNMIGTRLRSVNFAPGCFFTELVHYFLSANRFADIATMCFAAILITTCLEAIVTSIQMQEHEAAEACAHAS